jgi:hypothetical protein
MRRQQQTLQKMALCLIQKSELPPALPPSSDDCCLIPMVWKKEERKVEEDIL